MGSKETVVICVHGANQEDKTEAENHRVWSQALELEKESRQVRGVLSGENNEEISEYHIKKHIGCEFPQYVGWTSAWYGGVWQRLKKLPKSNRFSGILNPSQDGEVDERRYLLDIIERTAMRNHFDELVPFYELAVCNDTGKTLYEEVCRKVLDQIIVATENGSKDYILIGHSMGCAVTYNVLSHMSKIAEGEDPVDIPSALSSEYLDKLSQFISKPGKPFGLLTFGNYIGYNWSQKANTRLLYGERKRHYVYPDIIPRWYNFYTILGGDPYILDDKMEDTIISDEKDGYEDVRVWRVPPFNIGHGRHAWFRRDSFSKQLLKKLKWHIYR